MLGASRWRIGWVLVPLGLVGLAAYSVVIELTQLELARIDRACDLTDVVDNVSGAADRGRRRAGAALVLFAALAATACVLTLLVMTSPQPRPSIAQIPPYVAGKPPAPRADLTTYKLSSNENPYPPLPGVVEAALGGGADHEPLPRHGQHRPLRGAVAPSSACRPRSWPWPPARWR